MMEVYTRSHLAQSLVGPALPDIEALDVRQSRTYGQRLSLSAPGGGSMPTVVIARRRKSVANFCTWSSTARQVSAHIASDPPAGRGPLQTSRYAFAFGSVPLGRSETFAA